MERASTRYTFTNCNLGALSLAEHMMMQNLTRTSISALLLAFLLAVPSPTFAFTADELWNLWPEERFVTTSAPCLRPAELRENLESLASNYPDDLKLEEIGPSVQDRPIHMMTLGSGPVKVLLWSQMHGDEPSATPALLDIADYLLGNAGEPDATAILDNVTLLMIPMLNPDGAEVYQRRNAQGIDINRDALNLATPEGRLLKKIRDEHEPLFGFNLHDQNRRTAVGDTGALASNAVLAVSGDAEGTLTPERARAKRACAAIIKTLAPFMPGGMARYDEDWSPRSFGDNITAWGTAIVLIESGGLPAGHEMSQLTRLNFVAILTVLQEFVKNDLADHDPELYENLPRNQSDAWSELVVRGGFLLQPGTTTPYRADLAINLAEDDRRAASCQPGLSGDSHGPSQIVEVGDGRLIATGHEVDAKDSLIVAPFEVGVEGWKARRWFDSDALARLAAMGVGTVRWQVKGRHLERAATHARKESHQYGVRVDVTSEPLTRKHVVLNRLPSEPESDLLRDRLAALLGEKRVAAETETLELLGLLWPTVSTNQGPVIRRYRPASFLLLAPALDGEIDLDTAMLEGVWLDGREIGAGR
jgi:hypothetical protein